MEGVAERSPFRAFRPVHIATVIAIRIGLKKTFSLQRNDSQLSAADPAQRPSLHGERKCPTSEMNQRRKAAVSQPLRSSKLRWITPGRNWTAQTSKLAIAGIGGESP